MTIVGALPDNILAQGVTVPVAGALPQKVLTKLVVYIRTNFDPEYDLPEIKFRLVLPDGTSLNVGEADASVIAKSRSQAKGNNLPLAGLVSRAIFLNFQLSQDGIIRVEANIGDENRLVGILNFLRAPEVKNPISSIAQ